MIHRFSALLIAIGLGVPFLRSEEGGPPFPFEIETAATFQSSDPALQRLHDTAEARIRENIVPFTPSMKVLVEGGGYPNAWLETQPMGGEMFAKRDLRIALNNQLIFMLAQRDDGRLPGMVVSGATAREKGWDHEPPEGHIWMPEADLLADFEMIQGFCFPEPAWKMYHWIGRDRGYLQKLHEALAGFDAWLWRTRDSNGDGLLETWCVWDTGEDNSTRLESRWAPSRWPFEKPPGAEGVPDPSNPEHLKRYWFRGGPGPTGDEVRVPFASMDVMAYSYSARATLAKIAAELENGEETRWRQRAEEVRQRLIDGLWVPERSACFDLDREGKRLPELIHNNLRCMWYGIFTQEMADAFVDEHLLNPEAFWTPVPLVSIAIDEPLFKNAPGNNWSGQPQGLTYQRTIGALENYGRHAEVTRLGRKLLPVLIRNDFKFAQQLDPKTGKASGQKKDGYGPMILAALEYLTRLHGIHLDVAAGEVWWSAVDASGHDFTYTQTWGERNYRLQCKDGRFEGFAGDRLLFACTAGTRVVTDLDGKVLKLIGIAPKATTVTLDVDGRRVEATLPPNAVHKPSLGD
ncbi:MGH1-like glycoside hydrolase domain-containing protein [Haloferula sp. A504]|uniref:MGH1-like glycoside hydrolase domain-containing protein n=1 Tax=Haloferula sp. A504 TaxID=3373601 RepID=UPI0031C7F4C0|nr:hypothetical protein [Verrucomicrobiaceae bacterium E54]